MHEVITLQLGHRANYLATHFWNAQESYFTYNTDDGTAPSPVDHNVSFRAGLSATGEETFTPRTLIYDLKGGFGGLRKWGGLYDQQLSLEDGGGIRSAEDGVWTGSVLPQRLNPVPPSAYQSALDSGQQHPSRPAASTVRYWSDINRVFYHPRSVIQINDYELNSSLLPFEEFSTGEDLFANLDRDEDLLDRDLRPWAEECDGLQALQIYTSADDAWAGFAAKYAERLRDEFGKLWLWAWNLDAEAAGNGSDAVPRSKRVLRLTNAARTMAEMSNKASMYIPLSLPSSAALPPYVSHLDRSSTWNTTALLSAALESASLPARMRSGANRRQQGFYRDMEDSLNVNGRQRVAELRCSFIARNSPPSQTSGSKRPSPTGDLRIPPTSLEGTSNDKDAEVRGPLNLDIDLSAPSTASYSADLPRSVTRRDASRHGKEHVFAYLSAERGLPQPAPGGGDDDDDDDGIDSGRLRTIARFNNRPRSDRYRTDLPYPLLTSFPPVFDFALLNLRARSKLGVPSHDMTGDLHSGKDKDTNQYDLSSAHSSIGVRTALATSSGVSSRVKALKAVVMMGGGLLGDGAEERESLGNELGELAEGYEEGWSDGEDSGEGDDL